MSWILNLWFSGPGSLNEKRLSIGLLQLALDAKWKARKPSRE